MTAHTRRAQGGTPGADIADSGIAGEHRHAHHTLVRDLAALIEPVARLLLGEPTERLSSARELRWGRHGSLSVDLASGTWYDHEAGTGGGVLDLIRRKTGAVTTRDCMAWLERAGLIEGRAGTIDLDTIRQRREAERAARDDGNGRRQADAADRARRLWARTLPADPAHPYLARKRIQARTARRMGESLVLPVMDLDGRIHSLQFIDAAGGKKLLTGGRMAGNLIPVAGRMPGASRVLICEGWATGCTLADIEPDALVLAAIAAGNLRAVAVEARRRWRDAEIVVCCDRDPAGIRYGRAAAIAAGALVAAPEFPEGAEGTDYNDLACWLAEHGEANE